MQQKLISLIVPVYNTEKYLRHCLDTLVLQTYQNIEIVVVNDGSPDGSASIIEDYEQRFPELVKGYTIPNSGLSGARDYGVKHSSGKYIYFVDSDDYLAYNACELIAKSIETTKPDLVFTPIVRVIQKGRAFAYNVFQGPAGIDNMLENASCSYYSCAFRREHLLRFCPMPKMWYEDMASTRTIVSYAKRFDYLKAPIYYYIEHDDTIMTAKRDLRVLHTIKAVNKIIDECKPTYIDQVSAKAAQRITTDLSERWVFADKIIENAKFRKRYFEENLHLQKKDSVNQEMIRIQELPDQPMPKKIYVGAFDGDKFSEGWKKKLKDNVLFYDDGEIEFLNEKTCDVTEKPFINAAFKRKDYEFLNCYFACKRIYEEGGIYLQNDVEVDAPLNCLRYFEAFFSFETNTSFSAKVFGGIKDSYAFKALLEAYEWFSDEEMSASAILKNVLVSVLAIELNGNTQWKQKGIAFASRVFVLPVKAGFSLAHDKKYDAILGMYDCISDAFETHSLEASPFDLLKVVEKHESWFTMPASKPKPVNKAAAAPAKAVAGAKPAADPSIDALKKELKLYKDRANRMMNSKSWKLTKPLRDVGALVRKIKNKIK